MTFVSFKKLFPKQATTQFGEMNGEVKFTFLMAHVTVKVFVF